MKLWREYKPEVHIRLQTLLCKFGLGVLLPPANQEEEKKPEIERDLIVPCLVEESIDIQLKKFFTDAATCFYNEFGAVSPMGFSSQLVVRMMKLIHNQTPKQNEPSSLQLFKHGCALQIQGVWVRIETRPGEVEIQVKRDGDNWENVLKVISLFLF